MQDLTIDNSLILDRVYNQPWNDDFWVCAHSPELMSMRYIDLRDDSYHEDYFILSGNKFIKMKYLEDDSSNLTPINSCSQATSITQLTTSDSYLLSQYNYMTPIYHGMGFTLAVVAILLAVYVVIKPFWRVR